MSIKKKLRMGMVTAALGLALICGGTFAYFSDTVATNNTVAAGTLDLGITNVGDDGVIFDFQNKKPGDTFDYAFNLKNKGTLDIKDVTLFSSHLIRDQDGKIINSNFGSQILVKSLKVGDRDVIHEKEGLTLDDLKDIELPLLKDFRVNDDEAKVYVKFEFIKTDKDQNQYQGNAMKLNWKFEAMQED